MNGMMVPSVSAGSSHRAIRDACTPHVTLPSGAASSEPGHTRSRSTRIAGRIVSTFVESLGRRKTIQPSRVLPHDLALFVLRDALEIPLDDLPRVRPRGDGVGIVGGPHDVVYPDELTAGHPHPIVDERR